MIKKIVATVVYILSIYYLTFTDFDKQLAANITRRYGLTNPIFPSDSILQMYSRTVAIYEATVIILIAVLFIYLLYRIIMGLKKNPNMYEVHYLSEPIKVGMEYNSLIG